MDGAQGDEALKGLVEPHDVGTNAFSAASRLGWLEP